MNGRVFITSNRDEKATRARALAPARYDGQLIYPRDPDAGGSWIVLNGQNDAFVLLNGAFQKHEPVYPYRKSRGLVLLDLAASPNAGDAFEEMNLMNIEPFTLVVWQLQQLHEYRWDGQKKYSKRCAEHEPQIWSSATLYDEALRERRAGWFTQWLAGRQEAITREAIMDFHQFGGNGDPRNDLRMNRDGQLFTVSITGIEWQPGGATMYYCDLASQEPVYSAISTTLSVC